MKTLYYIWLDQTSVFLFGSPNFCLTGCLTSRSWSVLSDIQTQLLSDRLSDKSVLVGPVRHTDPTSVFFVWVAELLSDRLSDKSVLVGPVRHTDPTSVFFVWVAELLSDRLSDKSVLVGPVRQMGRRTCSKNYSDVHYIKSVPVFTAHYHTDTRD